MKYDGNSRGDANLWIFGRNDESGGDQHSVNKVMDAVSGEIHNCDICLPFRVLLRVQACSLRKLVDAKFDKNKYEETACG